MLCSLNFSISFNTLANQNENYILPFYSVKTKEMKYENPVHFFTLIWSSVALVAGYGRRNMLLMLYALFGGLISDMAQNNSKVFR